MEKPRLIRDLGMMYQTEQSKNKLRFGLYECPLCKSEFKARTNCIVFGQIRSCGCLVTVQNNLSNTRIGKIWRMVVQRCHNKKCKLYEFYGEVGITVANEWRYKIQPFYDWSLSNGYDDSLTLDRIDNSKGYSPENCRWVTILVQRQNQKVLKKTNTSGYRGVCYDKSRKKWISQIMDNTITHHLGRYEKLIDAVNAYNNYIIQNKTHHPLNPI